MIIHVVQPGDSIWKISGTYGVNQQTILDANGLTENTILVPGQTVVIPGVERNYVIQPGDSLWSISRKFGVSMTSIANANNLSLSSTLVPGTTIRIPADEKNYGYIEVNGYIEPSTPENDRRITQSVEPYLTFISPFSYRVNEDGSLIPLSDEAVLETIQNTRTAALMVITNFRDGNFDSDLADTILKNTEVQNTLIDNIVGIIAEKNYSGLNIDFERVPPADRELYNEFLRRVVAELRPRNIFVSTALAPKISAEQTGSWYGAHDYQAHGEIVDFVILMTYEWGWSGGPPMAVAPINQVRAVLNYALSVIPANKIVMGMPTYGYDWTLPFTPGGRFARRVSTQEAYDLAARYGAVVQYDERSQAPYINYTDDQGRRHIIWFEDARSVEAKLLMASELGLRGVSYWVLNVPFPQNWVVLNSMFNIEKVK